MLWAVNLLLALALSAPPSVQALQRCEAYRLEVRRQHSAVFGVDFPWWYGVGQLQQESGCRNVISNDGVGSQGLPQITWAVWRKYLTAKGVPSLSAVTDQLRAQALVVKNSFDGARPKKLWVAYQKYNGGDLVRKEISRAGVAEWGAARAQCHRKVVTFDSGQVVDACDINYDYSQKIYRYGNQYRIGADSPQFSYW